jgi:siroheme synthase
MGLASRARLSRLLLERGWPSSTPAAVLFAAGSDEAHTWRGTLDILDEAAPPDVLADAPGTIVIGDVVSLADVLAAPSADVAAAAEAFEGGQHAHRR